MLAMISFVDCQQSVSLYGIFARPRQNPLELYPLTHMPLCIAHPMPGYEAFNPHKCKRRLMSTPIVKPTPSTSWCTTVLTPPTKAAVQRLLANQFELGFDSGSRIVTTKLGPKSSTIYTHFIFTYFSHDQEISLLNVTGTNPKNITDPSLMFTYEVKLATSVSASSLGVSYQFFFLTASGFLFIIFFLLLKPDCFAKPLSSVVATIPSHNFLVVILAGAGGGVLAFFLSIPLMNFLNIEWTRSWWLGFSVPDAASSVATGFVTSLICTLLRLKDVASALYFAPLIFPEMCH
jgi:hypothetical protein